VTSTVQSGSVIGNFSMPPYASYVICGTPRSGSTLLCEMLISTGIAGRPNSFFRQQSIADWADRWDVDRTHGVDDAEFDARYIPAMLQAGAGGTGIFGLRLMWPSVGEAIRRLVRLNGGPADLAAQFETAFGPTLYIHLSRRDKVAQAISLVRAEQSGLWHLAADGSVYEGTAAPQPNVYDASRIGEVFAELNRDDAAWEAFFAGHQIKPVRLAYETMTANPQAALASILAALGLDAEVAKDVSVGTAKMASGTSREWADRFRAENVL
jgi:trehalose 2-sulfotransferase